MATFAPRMQIENTSFRKSPLVVLNDHIVLGTWGIHPQPSTVELTLEAMQVHLFWAHEGSLHFQFNPHYGRSLPEGQSFFLFHPKANQSATITLPAQAQCVAISIPFDTLHRLFMDASDTQQPIPFLQNPGTDKPVYEQRAIEPSWSVLLKSLTSAHHSPGAWHAIRWGLVLQLLGLYFDTTEPNTAACPFLRDQAAMRKLKEAKEHLLQEGFNPPTLRELSLAHGLNEYQLKAGFKEVYGTTVYGYVMDAKLNKARLLLDTGKLSVNEVAFHIGYQNPSHFIAAFKKKFGSTPKKYSTRPTALLPQT